MHHPEPARHLQNHSLTRSGMRSLDILLSVHNPAASSTSLPVTTEVRPTTISKVSYLFSASLGLTPLICKVNTALQLLLMGTTTVTPILPIDIGLPLQGLQYVLRSKSYIQTHLIYVTRT